MDTRKVQTVGNGTHTVSLPKEWTKSENISAGSEVTLHTYLDGNLVIQSQDDDDLTETVTVPLARDDAASIERTLQAAYAAGFERIVLEAADSFTDSQRQAINRLTRTLTGVTVVEKSVSSVTVRTLLDPNEVSIEQSVRHLKFVALSMHREATAALLSGDDSESPPDRDGQIDRLYAMLDRHFGRSLSRLDEVDALGLQRTDLLAAWATARELKRVVDHAERIVQTAATVDMPCEGVSEQELRSIAGDVRTVVEDAVSVVIGDATTETAHQTIETSEQLCEAVRTIDQRLFEQEGGAYRLTHALDSIRRTAERGRTIAEIGLRASVRRDETAPLWTQETPEQE